MKLHSPSSPSKHVKNLVFDADNDDDDDDNKDVVILPTTQTSKKKKKSSTTEKKSSKSNQDKDLDEKKQTNKKNTKNDNASTITNKKKSAKKSKKSKIEEKTKGGTKSLGRSTSSPGSKPLVALIDWHDPAQCREILISIANVHPSEVEDLTNTDVMNDILQLYNVGELRVAATLLASKSGQDQDAVEAIYSKANNGSKKKLIPLIKDLIDKKVSYEKK
jgi:hypothetical protein